MVGKSKKIIADFKVKENIILNKTFSLLKLIPEKKIELLNIYPGQFVQVKIDNSDSTFLRRPISICNYIEDYQELWLLVRAAGNGTKKLCESKVGEVINLILPLGHGFSIPKLIEKVLLAGGGAGIAPMLYFSKILSYNGIKPDILLGARTERDIMLAEFFEDFGKVYISTEDGSLGEMGLITKNSVLKIDYEKIYCCGPLPMMKAISEICRQRKIDCEVSLENTMACGIGACLCCVEKTVKGNVCVCTEGPVFNINQLNW